MSAKNPFKCGVPNCNQTFQLHKSLLKHTASAHSGPKTHSGPKITNSQNAFKCGVPGCGRSFLQLEHLRQHGSSHTSPNVGVSKQAFTCGVPSCGQTFYDHEALLLHGRESHPPARPAVSTGVNKPFMCGVPSCRKSFYDHEALLLHGRESHPPAKPTVINNIFTYPAPSFDTQPWYFTTPPPPSPSPVIATPQWPWSPTHTLQSPPVIVTPQRPSSPTHAPQSPPAIATPQWPWSPTHTPQSPPVIVTPQPPTRSLNNDGFRGPLLDVHPLSLIHTAKLPIMDVFLDDALTNIDANTISPWTNPVEWIQADSNYLLSIIKNIPKLAESDEIEQLGADITPQTMIYPRLIVYVFVHLAHCASHKRDLSRFKETLQQWLAWDVITLIENHKAIKDYLTDMFQDHLREPVSHAESIFRELLSVDVIGLCAHLTVVVTDDQKYKKVLARRDSEAQRLLDLLQARLDFYMDPAHKPRHVKCLIKLSRASGRYPECLILKGVDKEEHPVAQGGFGDVYKGFLQEKMIAVKVLRIYQDSNLVKLLKEFSSEAVIWRQLSHPNVLPFYGVYHLEEKTRRLCLASPWMENGNVAHFLRQCPDTDCVYLALDIAQGLKYLHGLKPSIIHGDLKGCNTLITQSRRACIADFGISTAKDSQTILASLHSTTRPGGTTRWQAPELSDPDETQHNSKASDIYAFACVCYEMFSDEIPFFEIPNDTRVLLSVMKGNRPSRPSHDLSRTRGLSDVVWELIETCWAHDPTKRPTAEHIIEQLHALPNHPVDDRPVDFNINLPSQVLYSRAEHPFSALLTAEQNLFVPHHLTPGSPGSDSSGSLLDSDGLDIP